MIERISGERVVEGKKLLVFKGLQFTWIRDEMLKYVSLPLNCGHENGIDFM